MIIPNVPASQKSAIIAVLVSLTALAAAKKKIKPFFTKAPVTPGFLVCQKNKFLLIWK